MKLNLDIFKRRVAPFILTAGLLPTLVGCANVKTGSNSYSITTSNEHDEKLLKSLKKKGFNISEIEVKDNFNIYKLENNIPEYFGNIKNGDIYNIYQPFEYNKCCTPIEFKKYIGSDNITYKDIKNTLNNNTNIDNNLKDILMEGINNLESNNFNIDLTVLNYNLSNLNIEYNSINEKEQVEIMAKFEAINHKVIINPDAVNDPLFKTILIHEVLGHASNIAYLDDEKLYCSTTIGNVMIEGNDEIIGYNVLGTTFEEGIAEYIRYYATKEKIDPNQTSYSVGLYMLLFMCKSCNLDIKEYINNGVESLIKKQQECDLGSVVHFIELLDLETTYKAFTDRELDWSYNDIMYQYLLIYTGNLYEKGKNKDDIETTINKLCNCNTNIMLEVATEDGYKVVYTPSINGDDVLQYQYLEENMYEYVDYLFEGNKVLSFK